MYLLQKCILLTCIFMIICPKRSRLSPAPRNFVSKKSKLGDEQVQFPNFSSVRSNYKFLRFQDSMSNLEASEPGFDLTDEEMVKFKIWPGGVIPYFIDDFSFDKVLRDRIRSFLDMANIITGIQFLELPRPPDDEGSRWVFFINRRGISDCEDYTTHDFTIAGVQRVVLGYECMTNVGNLAAIVLALVGVTPQHNAPDRQMFIQVITENIMPDKVHLFQEVNDTEWLFHDVRYDYASAGHYNYHKYSVNGFATIKPWGNVEFPVGEAEDFSYADVWKIRMLYNYISKKKIHANAPACSKLFEPGSNFSQYHPEADDEVEPRPRPSKYLGVNDNDPTILKDNKENENEKAEGQDEASDTNGVVQLDKETVNAESIEENEDGEQRVTQRLTMKQPFEKRVKQQLNNDELHNRSDFETEET